MLAWGWPLRASLSRALAAALLVTALSLARGEQENTGTAHWMRAADERLEWFARNWKNLLGVSRARTRGLLSFNELAIHPLSPSRNCRIFSTAIRRRFSRAAPSATCSRTRRAKAR
jgi:hypothetical protein